MLEDWETSRLDGYDRPVSFQLQLVSVDGLSGSGVLLLNHDRTATFSRQDGKNVGQDGKV